MQPESTQQDDGPGPCYPDWVDWSAVRQALVDAISAAASDTDEPLPAGFVQWFGAAQYYISDATMTGIWLRQTGLKTYAAPEDRTTLPAATEEEPDPDLEVERVRQLRWTVQLQVSSLVETGDRASTSQANDITSRLSDWPNEEILAAAGISIISIGEVQMVTTIIDDRQIEVANVDLVLQVLESRAGDAQPYIKSVSGSGEIKGITGAIVSDASWSSEVPPGLFPIYFGCGPAGLTNIQSLTPVVSDALSVRLPKVYPVGQPFFFCWRSDLGVAELSLSGFAVDPLETRSVTVCGVDYSIIETRNAFTWPAGLSFVAEDVTP